MINLEEKIPKDYIKKIAKASTYFAFKNGPIKELSKEYNISDEYV